jgi:hypothetical protein
MLWYVERRRRLQGEHPEVQPPAIIQTVSASIIRSQYEKGRYLPYGNRYAAICTLYSQESGPKLKDIRVQITFTNRTSGYQILEVSPGCWLNEDKAEVAFEPGTLRSVVVSEWFFRQPVCVPRFSGSDVEKVSLAETEPMDVAVTLYNAKKGIISAQYFRLQVGQNADTHFDRVKFEVVRG